MYFVHMELQKVLVIILIKCLHTYIDPRQYKNTIYSNYIIYHKDL